MHDVMKGVWAAVGTVGFFLAGMPAMLWFAAMPRERNSLTWVFVAAGTMLFALAVYKMIRLERKEVDEAPDFLTPMFGKFFERDGFCFAPVFVDEQGEGMLMLYYQSRYLNPSNATVALHPKAALDPIRIDIPCGPAEFGVVRLPIRIPTSAQGRNVKFTVGAAAHYPQGRGRTVRFKGGLEAGAFNSLGGGLSAGVAAFAALGGTFVSAAKVTLLMPSGVCDNAPASAAPEQETIWKWGDPVGGKEGNRFET
jgi:hypothetical protein